MASDSSAYKVIESVEREFEQIVNNVASHINVDKESVYPQPHTYLTTHLVCLKAASWEQIDFDSLAAISGASALFGYEPGSFGPKYALLHIGIDRRIADATGFGWEWIAIKSAEAAWDLLKSTIDDGIPLKAFAGENVIFAGYEDSSAAENRKVFALTDGGEYFVDWWSWGEFSTWAEHWGDGRLGRHAGRVAERPAQEIALRVLRDLVLWADRPPSVVEAEFPKAKFGLPAISAYSDDCADTKTFPDWHACHDVNPQWTVRNSTAVYLDRIVAENHVTRSANELLSQAADKYRAAYEEWRSFYRLLGHVAPRGAGKSSETRKAGAIHIRNALDHESAAIGQLSEALSIIDGV